MMSETMPTPPDATRPLPIGRILFALVAIGLLISVGRQLAFLLQPFAEWVDGLGVLGPLAFIGGYVVATVAFVPGSALTLAAGAIFGLGWGVVYVLIGATLGASAAFLVSRYIARSTVEDRVGENPKFRAIDQAVGEAGFKIVFLLRLSPVFPFNLLNYALGLTKVRFVDYLGASIGMLPGSLLYTYYGKLLGDVAQLATVGSADRDPGYYAVLLLGLVATIVVTTLVTRIARRALREATAT